MAQGPVPSYAEFLAAVAKPDAFDSIAQATVEGVLSLVTDEVVTAFGDRATPPILSWDGSCVLAVVKKAARVLMGHRGFKRQQGSDDEYIALAKEADDWLELVAQKRRHPTFTDSTNGLRPETPLITGERTADAWAKSRRACR